MKLYTTNPKSSNACVASTMQSGDRAFLSFSSSLPYERWQRLVQQLTRLLENVNVTEDAPPSAAGGGRTPIGPDIVNN